jgi:hypothetical protein
MEMLDWLIALPVLASAYSTSLLCRFARWRHRGVRWYFSLLGAAGAGGFTCLLIWAGLSLQSGQMPYGFLFWTTILEWMPAFVLPPAVIVTWYYRRKSRNKS